MYSINSMERNIVSGLNTLSYVTQEGFSNLSQKLKTAHQVKFNEGMLMRVYTF